MARSRSARGGSGLRRTARAFVAAAAVACAGTATPAAHASDAPDTVILTNGQRVRGVVTQADPERGTTIVLPDGTVRKYRPSEVARVAFEDRGASTRLPPEKPEKPERDKPERDKPRREEPKPTVRYEAPDEDTPRLVRSRGVRLGLQLQGGPFVVTGQPQPELGGQFGLAARFGYQFDPSFGVHWEPAVSFGLDSIRTSAVVWNTLLADVQLGQFFVAGGPGLAAIWQFNPQSTQTVSFAAVLRLGVDIPLQRRSGSNLSVGVEMRMAAPERGTLLFPSLFLAYELN